MSRKKMPGTSLELFLDTICNTFGGVLFIAILVAMLVQMMDDVIRPQSSIEPTVRRSEAARLRIEIDDLRAELERRSRILQTQMSFRHSESSEERTRLLHDWNQTIQQLEASIREEAEFSQEMAHITERIAATEDEVECIRMDNEVLKKEILTLSEVVAGLHKNKKRQLNMPRQNRMSPKILVMVIVRYNRVYLWHEWDSRGFRSGVNLNDMIVLGEDDVGIHTTPNPLSGILLDGSDDSRQKFSNLIKGFNPSTYAMDVIIYPDSFDTFYFFRSFLIEKNFEYVPSPTRTETVWLDRGGTTVPRQN